MMQQLTMVVAQMAENQNRLSQDVRTMGEFAVGGGGGKAEVEKEERTTKTD